MYNQVVKVNMGAKESKHKERDKSPLDKKKLAGTDLYDEEYRKMVKRRREKDAAKHE